MKQSSRSTASRFGCASFWQSRCPAWVGAPAQRYHYVSSHSQFVASSVLSTTMRCCGNCNLPGATRREQTAKRWRVGFRHRFCNRSAPVCKPLLAIVAAGRVDAVLATAAASDYAAGLAQRLGFRYALTTSPDYGAVTPRNSGTRKRDRVRALLHQFGWHTRPLVLFTDHIDDLPLMRDSDAVCWFGSAAELEGAEAAADKPRFVACRDLSAGELEDALSALEHDRAERPAFRCRQTS